MRAEFGRTTSTRLGFQARRTSCSVWTFRLGETHNFRRTVAATGYFRRLPKLRPLCKVRTMSLTPMMQQYQGIRRTLPPNSLLLFRLGDFYELFFEDAKLAAELLNVALTKRNGMPMCGVPFHA